jgi:hypothetical protein
MAARGTEGIGPRGKKDKKDAPSLARKASECPSDFVIRVAALMAKLSQDAESERPATVSLLHASNASPDLPGRFGLTPVAVAAFKGNDRIAEQLLSGHADPNVPDEAGSRRVVLFGHRRVCVAELTSGGIVPFTVIGACRRLALLVLFFRPRDPITVPRSALYGTVDCTMLAKSASRVPYDPEIYRNPILAARLEDHDGPKPAAKALFHFGYA